MKLLFIRVTNNDPAIIATLDLAPLASSARKDALERFCVFASMLAVTDPDPNSRYALADPVTKKLIDIMNIDAWFEHVTTPPTPSPVAASCDVPPPSDPTEGSNN